MGAPPAPFGSVAWIDAALRERLGPGATIGDVAFEGRLVRITGTRVPLGAAELVLDRVEVELGAGLPLGPLPLAARFVAVRGELSVPSVGLRVPLALDAGDPAAPRWFSGVLRATVHRPGAPDLALELPADLGPDGLTLHEGRLTSAGLAATLAGTAARRDDGGTTADLVLATARSRLAITLAVDPTGRVDGSRLAGRIACGDAFAIGFGAGDLTPDPDAALDLDLAARGPLAAPSLAGRVFAPAIVLGRASAPGAVCRLEAVSAVVDLDRHRFRYEQLRADVHGARLAGWGRVPFGIPPSGAAAVPLAALSLDRAGVGFVAAIASLAGVAVRAVAPASAPGIQVPDDLALAGEIMLLPDRAASGAFTLATARSELRLHLALAPDGGLVGSTLRGRLAVADAAALGLFPGPVRPRAPAALDLDARLAGSVRRPGITGRVESHHLVLDDSSDPTFPSFALADVSVLLDADGDHLAWHGLAGRFAGGSFHSSGRAGFGGAELHATVAWKDLRVEQLPTQADGGSLFATTLAGAASGELRFERHGFGDAPLAARGRLVIAEPVYLFTRMLAEPLARYGLPAVSARGEGPLSMRVRLDRGEILLDAIRGAVEGIEAGGEVRLGLDGRVRGRVVVDLLDTYLSRSPILAIPAILAGRVGIPVDLGGTVGAPEIRTDALAILEGLLAENRVGGALEVVLDALRGAAARPRARRPSKRRSDPEG